MSVKIQVNGSNGRPRDYVEVFVHWYSGISSGRTDSGGIYDTGVSSGGTIEKITIGGEQVYGKRVTDSNDFITLTSDK